MKKLMAANWKMYKLHHEAKDTADALVKALKGVLSEDREVLIIPPFTALRSVRKAIKKVPGFALGGQNFFPSMQGAFTGEIAPDMLLDMGCTYALAGHSERRHVMGESDDFVGKKVAFGLERGLSMILCVGETIDERKEGRLEEVVRRQMLEGLAGVAADVAPERMSIAYEPVWAIGTGLTAGPKEILDAHGLVRSILQEKFGAKALKMRIQYGGSVKPENAPEIMSLDNVDGVLVGGSSLSADSFSKIVTA
ncbi:MAG: triose-phosphate isomerase [Desulfovibrio sp.]|nr:triose-phosphate isomerase [Desulfovibrio sp.]MBI4961140.1 triose-phosphate isomerase [Desulfovibrio sp.]